MSRLAGRPPLAARSGLDIDGVTWTIPGTYEGLAYPDGSRTAFDPVLYATVVSIDHHARRADPREHGRQAARSVRDRPAGREVERLTQPRLRRRRRRLIS
jgi:hypothetical protein